MKMHRRHELHLSRKAFHFLTGTVTAYLFAFTLDRTQGIWILGSLGLFLFAYDLGRLVSPGLNKLAFRVMGPLMRREEVRKPSAQFYYLLGLMWAVGVLPKPVAIQAILTLAWLDPIAALVGMVVGKRRWVEVLSTFIEDDRPPRGKVGLELLGHKTVEGSLAGFAAAFVAGLVAWTGPWAAVDINQAQLWWPPVSFILAISGIGALVAAVAEAWPSQWDDNAMIPFWTGLITWTLALWANVPFRA